MQVIKDYLAVRRTRQSDAIRLCQKQSDPVGWKILCFNDRICRLISDVIRCYQMLSDVRFMPSFPCSSFVSDADRVFLWGGGQMQNAVREVIRCNIRWTTNWVQMITDAAISESDFHGVRCLITANYILSRRVASVQFGPLVPC